MSKCIQLYYNPKNLKDFCSSSLVVTTSTHYSWKVGTIIRDKRPYSYSARVLTNEYRTTLIKKRI